MARKVILTDDMEDSEVEADAGTVKFSFDGNSYEIDLSTTNKLRLQDTLAKWVAKARKVGGSRATPAKKPTKKPTGSGLSPDQLTAIREWARRNGHNVSDRGRVPADIILAFEQSQDRKAG